MSKKKIRVTNELIQRLEREGIQGLTRQECRALMRKGYLERRYVKADDGSLRNEYKTVRNII